MDKQEYQSYSGFLAGVSFFWKRDVGVTMMRRAEDWKEHTQREWELEYDALFRGADADVRMPLWASVFMDEKVLLNQTTLEVIQIYHKWGYHPVKMEGNPPDYIGEQFRFLAYLTASGIYEAEHGGNPEEITTAREDFILYYTCTGLRMMRETALKKGTYAGYVDLLQSFLEFLADESHEYDGFVLPQDFRDEELENVMVSGRHPEISNEEAHTIPTGGLNNCGGICVIRPKVQEGCMLSIESDCSSNHPQIRACVRGRGYRKTFLNPDRLRYPMKRIGARGSGKFERISWEEAIDIIYENWVRIRDTYGPGSRFLIYGTGVEGIMRPGTLMKRLLSLDGGYLDYYNSYSSAQVSEIMSYMYGSKIGSNSAMDLLNTKLLILWGHNPSETIFGPERNYFLSELKKKKVRIIAIDPRMNNTAAAYADQWIAPRPATDCALADAMAYVIWSEGLQDQHFMDTYCIGFDEEHMPEGVPWGESYHTYLFGLKDGVPKTPEWGEAITGVLAEDIRHVARELATTKPACIQAGLGVQRHGNGEQNARGIMMLCCLTGNVGIPGGGPGGNASNLSEHNTPSLFTNKVTNPYPGKIEIFSKTLYDYKQLEDIPAIPKYVPAPRGHQDVLREKYPLQLIGWHTRRRCHSIHDNNEWQDEVEMPSVWMHPSDAAKRGIRNGDMVEIYNDKGRVRIPAMVTNRIREGVAAMSQGAWYTPDKDGTDIRGSLNVLTSTASPSPLAKGNPQHTNLVEICMAVTKES